MDWHVSTKEEWVTLLNFIANENALSTAYLDKSSQLWSSIVPFLKSKNHWLFDQNGTDDYSFSALPGGFSSDNSFGMNLVQRGYWWSSTQSSTTEAWAIHLFYDIERLDLRISYKTNSSSIRCIQD